VVEGKQVRDVAMEYPTVFIKYHRGIEQLAAKKPRDFKTRVFVFVSPPDSGKSKTSYELSQINGASVYYKPRSLWWDGYEGQDSVVMDDYYGWKKYDELLKICGRYPYQVQVKGGMRQFTSKNIFKTSNQPIEESKTRTEQG